MKKIFFLFCTATIVNLSCKKDVDSTPSIKITSPNGEETFEAGQTISVKWNSKNISADDFVSVTLVNTSPGHSTVGVRLEPANPVMSSIGSVTKNDGEEVYQIPWRYSQEGRMLYNDTIGTKTFTLQLNVGKITTSGVWNVEHGIIESVSNKPFTIIRSRFPDGCSSANGYSVTTGQSCF
ncbi:MAG: hypothetical protein KBC11_01325 [Candidatus Pacebacteria bacterium]|nr:hypothetical protein [Candidatus Paceibacterota bacterium]